MHVRYSMSRGMPLVDDSSDEMLGALSGVFVHPDLGKIEGVFVRAAHGEEFLAVEDIAHWGKSIVVRDHSAIAPLEDRVRLTALWNEGRPVLGQRIVTEAGKILGTCADLQFETDTFRLEWLFPRRWFRWKRPIPASAIIEVRPDAVCVRDGAATVPVAATDQAAIAALEAIGGASAPAQG